MSLCQIDPFPVWHNDESDTSWPRLEWVFSSSSRLDPGVNELSPGCYSLGSDSAWTIRNHDLHVRCRIAGISLGRAFGPNGLVCGSAVLGFALEWTSSTSSYRQCGIPVFRTRVEDTGELDLHLRIPPGAVRGSIDVAVRLFVSKSGTPSEDERHLANSPGRRLGTVGDVIRLVFDGDGSLFPISEEAGARDGALWQLRCAWEDPTFDEFMPEYVSLVVNSAHPDFDVLKGEGRGYETPLFRQVLACWLAAFVLKLKIDEPHSWMAIDGGDAAGFEPGSIASAAWYLISRGELETGSPESLMASCQRWVDAVACPGRGGL